MPDLLVPPAAAPPRREGPPWAQVAGGIVVLIALLGGTALLVRFIRRQTHPVSPFVVRAHYLGPVEAEARTAVFFRRDRVGQVRAAAPNRPALQLLLSIQARATREATVILPVDGSIRPLTPGLTGRAESGRVVLRWSRDSVILVRPDDHSAWTLEPPLPPGLRIDGRTPEAWHKALRGGSPPILPGTTLGADSIRVRWDPPRLYFTLVAVVDGTALGDAFRRAGLFAEPGFDASTWVDPGSSLDLVGAVGVTSGTLQLRPGFVEGPHRGAGDTLDIGGSVLDLESALRAATTYLTSPAMLQAEPRTRLEEALDDAGHTLASLRRTAALAETLTSTIGAVARRERGEGAVGRLVLDPATRTALGDAITSVSSRLKGPKPLGTMLGLEPALDSLEVTLGAAHTWVDSMGSRASDGLRNVQRETSSRQPDTSVVDRVKQGLARLDTTLKHVDASVSKTGGKVGGAMDDVKGPAKVALYLLAAKFILDMVVRVRGIF